MSRNTGGKRGDVRQSALWGSGNRGGEFRSNALWGKGGRGSVVTLVGVLVLSLAAGAATAQGSATVTSSSTQATYLEPGLVERAQQNPNSLFKLIVQSNAGADAAEESFENVEEQSDRELQLEIDAADRAEQKANTATLKSKNKGEREQARATRERWSDRKAELQDLRQRQRGDLNDRFEFIKGVEIEMSGKRLLKLARLPGLTITEDAKVHLSDVGGSEQNPVWPAASGLLPLLPGTGKPVAGAPAIAIVDSGIDKNRADFGGGVQVVHSEVITSLLPNSPGDGRGHGTFVASIAAGSAAGKLGASPSSPIIDIDVMDDSGMARTSDVIAAAEWIYQNKARFNIRVANFSLHSAKPSNFTKDPLDRAVERLWFGGVVVVVAAGNYGIPNAPSGVKFAPGNDPFVITVGALDLNGDVKPREHDVPSWSAYGRTYDGFMKPDISAAGRYMVGAIPAGSTLAALKATNIVSPGYIRLSGTSFSSPVVAGAAAQILARRPSWTPDQVKGALMMTARRLPAHEVPAGAGGVGEVNAWKAAAVTDPMNPNKALNAFVKTDVVTNATAFDAVSWTDAARASVSWDAVSWDAVSWTDVSWSDVSWSDVSWTDVSWSDVLAVADVSWEDAANDVAPVGGEYVLNPLLEAEWLLDPELNPDAPPVAAAPVVTALDLVPPVPAPVVPALPALPIP